MDFMKDGRLSFTFAFQHMKWQLNLKFGWNNADGKNQVSNVQVNQLLCLPLKRLHICKSNA